jgi:predicted ATPase
MKRFVVTGAPGSGKTCVIRQLELEGFAVVEEAATDIIALDQSLGNAEPWKSASFLDAVAGLQKIRQLRTSRQTDEIQFHDRSVICTAALARYLEYPITTLLAEELNRIAEGPVFEKQVFFLQNLGFITPTEARRISLEETLRFERIHEATYRDFGFEIVPIGPATIPERVTMIKKITQQLLSSV